MNKKLEHELKKLLQIGGGEFPPKVAKLFISEFIEYIPGESLTTRFLIESKFDNPFGITFGGTYAMYFDMVMGPFSGLIAKTSTTSLDINITFIKPLSVNDGHIDIKVTVMSHSRQFLILHGAATKIDGTLVATATSRMYILNSK